ncbi:Ribonuclease/ribotoxin [Lentithecium fluviatile CBS 122367]|uniref:ribonuclease T1 n=1 Tax=Lentithecium fluviatile CBS 122367 TaxID=1168545 RepID=A0A6G1IS63_9PLEO|nr:Ribonuclease/ribotoxin [Lentithecium fluviatile CBS 122367]
MRLTPSILLAFGSALLQTSSALPATAGILSKRTVDNLPPSDQFVACPGYRYSREQVEKAIQQGIITTPTNEPQPGGYPHIFGNNRKLPFSEACNGKTLYEFPLLHGDSIYGGGDPGADRVVFYIYTDNPDTNPTDDGAYCGVMTHDGAPVNEFALCPVED